MCDDDGWTPCALPARSLGELSLLPACFPGGEWHGNATMNARVLPQSRRTGLVHVSLLLLSQLKNVRSYTVCMGPPPSRRSGGVITDLCSERRGQISEVVVEAVAGSTHPPAFAIKPPAVAGQCRQWDTMSCDPVTPGRGTATAQSHGGEQPGVGKGPGAAAPQVVQRKQVRPRHRTAGRMP